MLRNNMNTELDFRKTDCILAMHQLKTYIYVIFMVGNTNIFSCKISESKNMFRNKFKKLVLDLNLNLKDCFQHQV